MLFTFVVIMLFQTVMDFVVHVRVSSLCFFVSFFLILCRHNVAILTLFYSCFFFVYDGM